jgi:hypothetical protein
MAKCIWKSPDPKIAKERKKKTGSCTVPHFKASYRATVIKIGRC